MRQIPHVVDRHVPAAPRLLHALQFLLVFGLDYRTAVVSVIKAPKRSSLQTSRGIYPMTFPVDNQCGVRVIKAVKSRGEVILLQSFPGVCQGWQRANSEFDQQVQQHPCGRLAVSIA